MGDADADSGAAAAVECALVAMRRSQSRRALAGAARHRASAADAGAQPGVDPGAGSAVFAAMDAVEAGARTVTDVAGALAVDQPRASRLVARAVERGLVCREADQRDGRRALLALTARGRQALAGVHRFRREVAARAMADWTPAERAAFADLLPRFVAAFTRITTEPAAGDDASRPGARGR